MEHCNMQKNLGVIGLGNIGLPTAILAALKGYKVLGIDTDVQKLKKIAAADSTIVEIEMLPLLQEVLSKASLQLASCLQQACDVWLVCVQTPLTQDNSANLDYLDQALRQLSPYLRPGNTIILESTLPVGSTNKIVGFIEQLSGLQLDRDFYLAYSPERVLPGNILKEFLCNDRVIGGASPLSAQKAVEFYCPLVEGQFFLTDASTAECVKLVENSYRSVQLAFSNQIYQMAENAGLDGREVINLASRHPRVKLLQPGIGVGGDCVPVHPYFLKESLGIDLVPSLVAEALEINLQQTQLVIDRLMTSIDACRIELNRKPVVLLLGLTYKPNVRDLRNSPALNIAQSLTDYNGGLITVYDPWLEQAAIEELGLTGGPLPDLWRQADIVVMLVGHSVFAKIPEHELKHKTVLDCIGFWQNNDWKTKPLRLKLSLQGASI